MAQRRHHYEGAFEQYLRSRRVPYVAVDEARKALLPAWDGGRAGDGWGGGGIKSFDFVLYGGARNLLVEIKGRRIGRGARLECWVTAEDIESLVAWERLFGEQFQAVFVFVYWCDEQPAAPLYEEIFEYRGRWYALRAIEVRGYRAAMRVRSERWGTVHLPAAAFERLSGPLAAALDAGRPEPAAAAGV